MLKIDSIALIDILVQIVLTHHHNAALKQYINKLSYNYIGLLHKPR